MRTSRMEGALRSRGECLKRREAVRGGMTFRADVVVSSSDSRRRFIMLGTL